MASKKTPTTQNAASRIQSTQAKAGNDTGKGSFPARAQAAAANNAPSVGGTPKAPTAKAAPAPKSPSGGKSKK